MKYLESINADLWQEISQVQFCEEIESGTFVDFDESEKSQLESTFANYHQSYFAVVDSENALFLNSPFKFNNRLRILGQGFRKNINEIIYLSGGRGDSHREFRVAKMDDEWYLVQYKPPFPSGGPRVMREPPKDLYFKCDQVDGFLDLLHNFTKKLKKRDFGAEQIKSERTKKMNRVISRIKSMTWEEFQKFYDRFMK